MPVLQRRLIEKPQLGGAITSLNVFGHGKLGGKINGVFDNAQPLVECGLAMPPPGFALASGFFERFEGGQDGIRERMKAINEITDRVAYVNNVRLLFDEGLKFSDQEMEAIAEIERTFRGQVIAIRPSLEGESRGVGVTKTKIIALLDEPVENIETLVDAIKSAYRSAFSKDAFAYTKRKGVEPLAALWILPVIGEEHRHSTSLSDFEGKESERFFYPWIASCGYTHATLDKKGKALVVFGMGSKAVKGQGLPIIFDADTYEPFASEPHHLLDAFIIDHGFVREFNPFQAMSTWASLRFMDKIQGILL